MKSCRTAFLRQSTLHLLPLQPKEIQVRSAFKEAPQQPRANSALPQRTPRTSSARHAASAAEPEPVPAPCRRAVTAIEQKHRAAGLGRATATHGTPPTQPAPRGEASPRHPRLQAPGEGQASGCSPPASPPHQPVSSSSQPARRSSSSGRRGAASSRRPSLSPPPGSSGGCRRAAALGLRQRPSDGEGEAAAAGGEGEAPPLRRRLGLAGAAGRAPWRLRSCSFCFSSFFTSSCSFRTSASAFTLEPTSSMAPAGCEAV